MSLPDSIAIDNPPPWPPPRAVRAVLRRARQRYHAARVQERPARDCPLSYLVLISMGDMLALRDAGYWPLPPEALRWISESPRSRARRRRRQDRRIADVALDLLADQLPDAVAALSREGVRRGA